MKSIYRWLAAAILATATVCAHAQTPNVQTVAQELKQGGYVIVFRHGATNRDQADTDPLNHDNVAKQRVLSANGIDIARQVGSSVKKLGIPIGNVYTSKFNRAVETGKLVSGGAV